MRNKYIRTSSYAMNFFMNRLWNSVRRRSFCGQKRVSKKLLRARTKRGRTTNSFFGVSLVPRAWFLKMTSSSQRLFTPKEEDVVEDIMEGVGEAP